MCVVLLLWPILIASIAVGRKAQEDLQEGIEREWKNSIHIPSVAELSNCFDVLQALEGSSNFTADEESIVISRVCQRNISQGNLVSINTTLLALLAFLIMYYCGY